MKRSILFFVVVGLGVACTNPAAEGKAKGAVEEAKAVKQAEAQRTSQPVNFNSTNSKIDWIGAKVSLEHRGGFKRFNGAISIDEGGVQASSVTVNIDTTSVWADNDTLSGHLKSAEFFATEEFPKASFVSTSIASNLAEGATHTVTGNLSIRGITKSISFPAKIRISAAAVVAKAEFTINRKDWNIVYAGAPDDLIADEVVLQLAITAPRS